MLTLKSTRTSQPQGRAEIDRGNPITLGLDFAQIDSSDLQTENNGTLVKTAKPWGNGELYNGSSSYKKIIAQAIGRTPDITIAVLHSSTVLPPTGGPYSHILAASVGTVTADYYGYILMLGNATAYPLWRIYQGSGAQIGVCDATSGALNDGKPHITIARCVGAANGSMNLNVDGKLINSTTHATARTTFTNNTYIGYARHTFWGKFNGEIGLVAIWDRSLSDAEVASLSANPWQIFK